jgi:hypothetical protein
VEIELVEGVDVEGRVVNDDGEPVVGVQVGVFVPRPPGVVRPADPSQRLGDEGRSLPGHSLSQDGRPISGSQARWTDQEGRLFLGPRAPSQLTDDDGRFRVRLPPGETGLVVSQFRNYPSYKKAYPDGLRKVFEIAPTARSFVIPTIRLRETKDASTDR